MTLYRGTAVLNGSNVQIQAPQGFAAINGLRLTNYTGETLLINNVASTGQGEEYLFPQQQMVYHTRNISAAPTAQGFFTHAAFPPSRLFVEWSDDSINDFNGTYPAFLPQGSFVNESIGSPVILNTTVPITVAVPASFTNFSIDFNSVDGVQNPGPLIIPAGFELSLQDIQVSATYTAPPIGVQQFTVALAEVVGGVITRTYAQTSFTLSATLLNDTPHATHNANYVPPRIIPAGATPVWVYFHGPAGVSFAATANGVLLPA